MLLSPGILGFSVVDVPSFIPYNAIGLKVTNTSDGYYYEYESSGEWRKAYLMINDGSRKCMNVSEGVEGLKLYQIIDGERIDITSNESYNVEFIDSDGNGGVDTICWTIP
jgi:hypothetical protein